MKLQKLTIHLNMLVGIMLLFAATSAIAKPAFSPLLSATDPDQQHIYLLDVQEISFNKVVLRKYRLWQNNTQTQELKIISWLGTRWLPSRLNIVGMSWDSTYQRLLFADAHARNLFSMHPGASKRTLLSGAQRGAGPAFANLGELIVDPVQQRIILLDMRSLDETSSSVLTQVALDSGDRRPLLTSATDLLDTGTDTDYSLAFDANTYQLFLSYGPGVLALDLHSAESRRISDSRLGIGVGPTMIRGTQLAFDFNRHRLLISEPLMKRVMSVDIATGERLVLETQNALDEQNMCWPQAITILQDTTLIADTGHQTWLRLDLGTNQWQSLTPAANSSGASCAQKTQAALTKLVAKHVTHALQETRQQVSTTPVTANMETPDVLVQLQDFLGKFLTNLGLTLAITSTLISIPMLMVIFYPLFASYIISISVVGTESSFLSRASLTVPFLLLAFPTALFLIMMSGALSIFLGSIATLILSPFVAIATALIPATATTVPIL